MNTSASVRAQSKKIKSLRTLATAEVAALRKTVDLAIETQDTVQLIELRDLLPVGSDLYVAVTAALESDDF